MLPMRSFTSNPSRYSAFSMLVGEAGLSVDFDIAYDVGARQRMDIYRRWDDPGRGPVALFFYGGTWRHGCRSCYGFVGAALASQGIPTAIADYRLFPDVRWPVFQEDAALAFRFVAKHLGLNGHRPVILIGHSAGAHLAAHIALDRRWNGGLTIGGLVGLAGPYTFDPSAWASTAEIFRTAGASEILRPIALIQREAPPTLLLHGAADDVVDSSVTRLFADALQAAGTDVTVEIFPGAGHRDIVVDFARPFRWRSPVLNRTVDFIHTVERSVAADVLPRRMSASATDP